MAIGATRCRPNTSTKWSMRTGHRPRGPDPPAYRVLRARLGRRLPRTRAEQPQVRTASLWQARQPVYNTSVERWRRYERWLGELRELVPAAEAEGS